MTVLARSTFRREPAAVPAARAFVKRALASLGLHDEAVDRLVLASAEACNNVVLHASGETFALDVVRDGPSCRVSVIDSGQGFRSRGRPVMPPAYDTGNRGLALMYTLVDDVHVDSSPAGTAVVLELRLATNGAGNAAVAPALKR